MSDCFTGEIRILAANFAPLGWAKCNGQLLPLSQNTALFALLGTYYGGNGKSTFALPNLDGSVAVSTGAGAGLTERTIGNTGGASAVTLLPTELPVHTHTPMRAVNEDADKASPVSTSGSPGRMLAATWHKAYAAPGTLTTMGANAILPTGGGIPHNNMQPYLGMSFCICMLGTFPPRS